MCGKTKRAEVKPKTEEMTMGIVKLSYVVTSQATTYPPNKPPQAFAVYVNP